MATIPSVIGKYKIIRELAKGGMGTVYIAEHPSLKKEVILKKLTLKSSNTSIRERFKREAQILIDLNSPYIVRMFDYFTENRSDYIVLEYVDGMALDKLIKRQGKLPPQIAMTILLDSCLGLKRAHFKGIIHRDIKPANILISKRCDIKVADFGIASGEKEDGAQSSAETDSTVVANDTITRVGSTLGTPAYMSPEQLEDSSSVDGRADIYSLGVMLYEMVTGKKPYAGDMKQDTLECIEKGKYTPPSKLVKDLPPVINALVKKMMHHNKNKRYKTLAPIIKKINGYLKKYVTHDIRVCIARLVASKSEAAVPVPDFPTRHYKAKRNITVALVLALLIGLGLAAWAEGFFHATLLRKWYTPVTLTMEVPSTASANADLPARAFFFENDNDTIPEVKNTRRIFSSAKGQDSEKNTLTVRTKAVYLKPGDYRIKIATGPYVWWKSMSVGHEKASVMLDFLKNETRHLTIHTYAEDSSTREDISSKTRFFVETAKGRVDVRRLDSASLSTGAVYKVYAVAEGYEEEYFGLRIDWYQDELFINAALKKKNGQ